MGRQGFAITPEPIMRSRHSDLDAYARWRNVHARSAILFRYP